MKTFKLLLLAVLSMTKTAFGEQYECLGLGGLWQDATRGRTLLLEHSLGDGKLSGFYTHGLDLPWPPTSVRTTNTNNTSEVIGVAPADNINTSFAFSVMYDNGYSIISWTAQCQICNGEETLKTTWLSQRSATDCADQWQSTLTGQMSFSLISRDQTVMSEFSERAARSISKQSSSAGTGTRVRQPCSIAGVWINDLGSVMNITYTDDNSFMGEYRTAVERYNGSSGGFRWPVYGHSNTNDPNSAIAFNVNWNNGTSTTEWTGTCLPCGENQAESLATMWVLKSAVEQCGDDWFAYLLGSNIFTRYDQEPYGG